MTTPLRRYIKRTFPWIVPLFEEHGYVGRKLTPENWVFEGEGK